MKGRGKGDLLCLCLGHGGGRFVFDDGGEAVGLRLSSCCQGRGCEFSIHFLSGAPL